MTSGPPGPGRDEIVDRLRRAGCVFAEAEADLLLEAADGTAPARLVDRRAEGEPLEHVLGWAAFDGLRVAVGPGVFVPRRRTEALVAQAWSLIRPGALVVDLCCGCGAIGAALLARAAAGGLRLELHCADVDPVALRYARRNVEPFGGDVHQGDLFDALPPSLGGRVDVLVANVPYVPRDALALMPREARLHESPLALDGGDDGLAVARRIAGAARRWLAPGGRFLVEVSRGQLAGAVDLLRVGGLAARVVVQVEDDVVVAVGTGG